MPASVTALSWQRVSVSGAKSSPTSYQVVSLRTRLSAQAITIYIDDALPLDADIDIPYHDGDSALWQWDSTPNASTSRGYVLIP